MDEDPSNNDIDNLAVLCLECHHSTQLRGGFDRKLDAAQVRLYRNEWHQKVEASRAVASNAGPVGARDAKDERAFEHDRGVYAAASAILSEQALVAFLERLWNDDSYLASLRAPVNRYHLFLRAADNEFITPPLPERAAVLVKALDHLQEFLAAHFFRFGMQSEDPEYCLHPNWCVDLGGDPKYMEVYAGFEDDLGDCVQAVFTAWRDFRHAIKQALIV